MDFFGVKQKYTFIFLMTLVNFIGIIVTLFKGSCYVDVHRSIVKALFGTFKGAKFYQQISYCLMPCILSIE